MSPEEFCALPPALAFKLLLDASTLFSKAVEAMEKPKLPPSPKYDHAIYRAGGIQWASETDAEGLRYWRDKNLEGSEHGEYAEKNAKNAKQLGYWLAWRDLYPGVAWTGTRNDRQVTADAPSWKPRVHDREPREGQSAQKRSLPSFDEDPGTGGDPGFDDENIPF